MSTTITFRTEEELKEQATTVFESLGMSLSTALNLFMKQAVLKQRYPCSLDLETQLDASKTYPSYFFDLYGSGRNLGLEEEPEELALDELELTL